MYNVSQLCLEINQQKTNMGKITIYSDRDVWAAFQKKCSENGFSGSAVLLQIMKNYCAEDNSCKSK